VNLSLLPHIFHKLFHNPLLIRTLLSMVRFKGNPNRQHFSRNVKRANVTLDVGAAAAAATIVLVVRSTYVTIHLFPNLVASKGPIISMTQLVNGCTGIKLWYSQKLIIATLRRCTCGTRCLTWLIHICDVSHSCVRHETFIHET
jgi:hypothetical protein